MDRRELLEKAPTGMYAIAKSNIDEAVKGVIFCLKKINQNIKLLNMIRYYNPCLNKIIKSLYNYITKIFLNITRRKR